MHFLRKISDIGKTRDFKKTIRKKNPKCEKKIDQISNTNFRVYMGPFDNIKSLKKAFDDITPLNFENIEIIKL